MVTGAQQPKENGSAQLWLASRPRPQIHDLKANREATSIKQKSIGGFPVKAAQLLECPGMKQRDEETYRTFLGLFAAHEAALRAYVRRTVPTRNDAGDVMQGVALTLWKKLDELDHYDNFRKWAFGVARLESLAWLRDKARDRRVLSNDLVNTIADEGAEIEDRLELQREVLETCLERLPFDQRALVLKAYTVGVQVKDVAQESGRTVPAFYQWLHRIRVQLQACTRRAIQAREGTA